MSNVFCWNTSVLTNFSCWETHWSNHQLGVPGRRWHPKHCPSGWKGWYQRETCAYQSFSHFPRFSMLNCILAKLLCAAPLKYLTLPLVIVDGPGPLAPVLHDTPLLAHSFPKFFFLSVSWCMPLYVRMWQ